MAGLARSGSIMAKPLVSDHLWPRIEPLLPKRQRRNALDGRPPLPGRDVLSGLIFVRKTGIPWEDFPQEMNRGSGMTCWRRLRDGQKQGV